VPCGPPRSVDTFLRRDVRGSSEGLTPGCPHGQGWHRRLGGTLLEEPARSHVRVLGGKGQTYLSSLSNWFFRPRQVSEKDWRMDAAAKMPLAACEEEASLRVHKSGAQYWVNPATGSSLKQAPSCGAPTKSKRSNPFATAWRTLVLLAVILGGFLFLGLILYLLCKQGSGKLVQDNAGDWLPMDDLGLDSPGDQPPAKQGEGSPRFARLPTRARSGSDPDGAL